MMSKLVVLTITNVKPEDLRKPFCLHARLPRNSRILSVHSLPNILEVLGMGSGGGAPGFSVLIPTLDPKEPKQPEQNHLFLGDGMSSFERKLTLTAWCSSVGCNSLLSRER